MIGLFVNADKMGNLSQKKILNRKKLVTHILETHVGPVESILEATKNKKIMASLEPMKLQSLEIS